MIKIRSLSALVGLVLAMMAVGPSSAAESNRAQQPWEINWTRAPSMAPATPPASSQMAAGPDGKPVAMGVPG